MANHEVLSGDWKGRRVLVTGADGFIGSHLCERLLREGAVVRAFCLYNPQGSWGWLHDIADDLRGRLDVRLGDVRDAGFVRDAVAGSEIVFHLAALIAIPYSYLAPTSFIETNVLGTLNVLEAARMHGVRRVVHASTSEVYGTPATLPIRETHPLSAQSPYAASKVAADQLALSYYCSFDVPVTIVRPFNTYGPRQSTRAVLPTILVQLMEGKQQIELGRLDTRRDLTFVTDTVDGFVRAGSATGIDGQVTQLGTGTALSIQELFDRCCRVLDRTAQITTDARRVRPERSEVVVLQSDPTLARERLGWVSTVAIDEGLQRTADWLADHRQAYDSRFFHV